MTFSPRTVAQLVKLEIDDMFARWEAWTYVCASYSSCSM
jgi:hypothetical protein